MWYVLQQPIFLEYSIGWVVQSSWEGNMAEFMRRSGSLLSAVATAAMAFGGLAAMGQQQPASNHSPARPEATTAPPTGNTNPKVDTSSQQYRVCKLQRRWVVETHPNLEAGIVDVDGYNSDCARVTGVLDNDHRSPLPQPPPATMQSSGQNPVTTTSHVAETKDANGFTPSDHAKFNDPVYGQYYRLTYQCAHNNDKAACNTLQGTPPPANAAQRPAVNSKGEVIGRHVYNGAYDCTQSKYDLTIGTERLVMTINDKTSFNVF
jgi:hypothetical protein